MFNLENIQGEWRDFFENHIEDIIYIHDKIYKDNKIILPKKENVFKIFEEIKLNDIKVIILGQDPYYSLENNIPYAMGYSFGISQECKKIPPSLKNIFKEMKSEVNDKTLHYLVKQGVLLLNCSLTVEYKKPNSHFKYWQKFINNLIEFIDDNTEGIIFMLWGNFAINYSKKISKKHYILTSGHPSPLAMKCSNPFLGNNHFNKANEILIKNNKEVIKW